MCVGMWSSICPPLPLLVKIGLKSSTLINLRCAINVESRDISSLNVKNRSVLCARNWGICQVTVTSLNVTYVIRLVILIASALSLCTKSHSWWKNFGISG